MPTTPLRPDLARWPGHAAGAHAGSRFYEQYDEETQHAGAGTDPSTAKYGAGATTGVGIGAGCTVFTSGATRCRRRVPALERLAAEESGSPFDGVILEYTNPLTGGPAMPTIACYIQMLHPGQHTQAHRQVCCTNYHVIEGSGYSLVGGRLLDWEDKDVFTVPTWTFHEHGVNTGNRPAFLFSFTDAPVMKAIDLYREEAKV